MYEKLQLICNYFWQESRAGLWSVMTGTLWSRQPYPDHWSFVDGFSCLSFIVAWQCGMPTVSFIAALVFEKSLYRRTCPLDNVIFRRNWRLVALFKAAKVSSFGLVVVSRSVHPSIIKMLSTVSLQIILQLELHILAKLPVMYTPLSARNPKGVACLPSVA